jgi:hypothetical protein
MCDACRIRARSSAAADEERAAAAAHAPPLAPALIGDRRVAARSMAPVRATLALQLQRSGGNRLVGRMLARETATADAAPAKPALKTGKELDAMLLASGFFKPYVQPKIGKGIQAEGHVHIHDADAFKELALQYLEGKDNPKTGAVFTDAEAEKFETTMRAFQDDRGEVRVHEKRADDGTVIHEAMHLFSSNAFVDAVGYNVNEGATEVFARRLASENGVLRAGFPQQHRLVMRLVSATNERLLADAFFNGALEPLRAKLDASKGAGTWAKWLGLMTTGDYEEAAKVV